MKVSRSFLFALILIAFVVGALFGGIQSENASVTSSPQSILFFFSAGLVAVFFPRKKQFYDMAVSVGLGKRLFAIYIDMTVAGGLFISIGIIPILILEYAATGIWQWSYVREVWEPRDVFTVLLILSTLFGIFYYFTKHASSGLATPGQYTAGYRIIPSGTGNPDFNGRTLYGGIAFSLSIITWLNAMNIKDGIYWWDRKSNTRAVATI